MAQFNKDIFRAYDVRGAYPGDFDTTFAQRLASRVAGWLKAGTIVVGRDERATSDELTYACIDGAVYAGANVIDIGVVSTPQYYWAIRSLGAAGGIMVTASHNALSDNGFKVIAARGDSLEVIGGDIIRQVYDSATQEHASKGSVEYRSILDGYAAAVAYAAQWRGGTELCMAIDAPAAVRDVFASLGPVASDERFGVRFDPDGDRVAFFDRGAPIPADFIFLLLAEQLELRPLVFDLRFSRVVHERLAARQTPFTISKVGRLGITEAMHRTRAIFGGETSGHYYWKEFGGMECSELTALRVYEVYRRSGRTLTELVAPYRVNHKSEEINIPIRDTKEASSVLAKLAAHYSEASQDRTDGLTVQFEEWWFNIRPSNTEPLLRLVVEADTKKLLDQMIKEVEGLASS